MYLFMQTYCFFFPIYTPCLWARMGLAHHGIPTVRNVPGALRLPLNERACVVRKIRVTSHALTVDFVHRSAAVDPEECSLLKGNFLMTCIKHLQKSTHIVSTHIGEFAQREHVLVTCTQINTHSVTTPVEPPSNPFWPPRPQR